MEDDDEANWSAEKVAEMFASGASIFESSDSGEEAQEEGMQAAKHGEYHSISASPFPTGHIKRRKDTPLLAVHV